MTACILAQTTIDTEEGARSLATRAIEERLAACVQVDGPLTSVYRWKETVETGLEWRLTFKTHPDRLEPLARWLQKTHPYKVPEWIAWPVAETSEDYGEWIRTETLDPA
jgi:periplasmic divalent cation tolerance protein